ncbi:DUF6161 domain-containing protein [Legionella pneumophila]
MFISVLSIFAFLIKVFSRLAFSSFHLQRDAEEREQLTPFSTFQEFLK